MNKEWNIFLNNGFHWARLKKKCPNSKRKPKAKSHYFNNDWSLGSFKKSVYQSIREQYIHVCIIKSDYNYFLNLLFFFFLKCAHFLLQCINLEVMGFWG